MRNVICVVVLLALMAAGAAWMFRMEQMADLTGMYRNRWTNEIYMSSGDKIIRCKDIRKAEEYARIERISKQKEISAEDWAWMESKGLAKTLTDNYPGVRLRKYKLSDGKEVEVPDNEKTEFFEAIKEKGLTAQEL